MMNLRPQPKLTLDHSHFPLAVARKGEEGDGCRQECRVGSGKYRLGIGFLSRIVFGRGTNL